MKKDIQLFWQTPPEKGIDKFDYVGCVIFNGDVESGEVLWSRVADPTLETGENFWHRLALSPDDIRRLRLSLSRGEACWLISPLGVGILSARYDVWMGTMVYLHIHDHPKALRRLLYRGYVAFSGILPPPLGGLRTHTRPEVGDELVAKRCGMAISEIELLRSHSLSENAREGIPLCRICRLFESMASRAGVFLTFDGEDFMGEEMPVMCLVPRMMEFCTFFCMTMLGDVSRDRKVHGDISLLTTPEGVVPNITLHTLTESSTLRKRSESAWFDTVDHVLCQAEINGVYIRLATDVCDDMPLSVGDEAQLFLRTELTFSEDPAKHPPAGLKNKQHLIFDEICE